MLLVEQRKSETSGFRDLQKCSHKVARDFPEDTHKIIINFLKKDMVSLIHFGIGFLFAIISLPSRYGGIDSVLPQESSILISYESAEHRFKRLVQIRADDSLEAIRGYGMLSERAWPSLAVSFL